MYTVNKLSGSGSSSGGGGGSGSEGGGGGVWQMRRLPKGAAPEEKGGKEYNELVIKHAMISRACKQVVLEYDSYVPEDDDEHADLAQTIFQHPAESGTQLAKRYCAPFCVRAPRDARDAKEEL